MAGRISAHQEAFEISDSSTSSDLEILEPFTPVPSSSTAGVKRRRQDNNAAGVEQGGGEGARRLNNSVPMKRKPPTEEELAVKVEWTDESDGEYERLKKKKKTTARVRGGKKAAESKKTNADVEGKGPAVISASNASSSRGTARKRGTRRASNNDTDSIRDGAPHNGNSSDDGSDDTAVPDYIKQRRREFDERTASLREAGLRLPPDYTDIYFSDDDRRQWGRNSRGDGQRTSMKGELACRPQFEKSVRPSRERKDIVLEYSGGVIPACIAQYLRDYQVVGVQFLHQMFVYQRGGILGDDMGLGKTVQVAAFLTAAFGKTGDERDNKRMRKMRRAEAASENDAGDGSDQAGGRWYPRVLVVCPGSLIQNWSNELNRWGWWHVDLYHGAGKDDVLQAARAGRLEIMVTTYVTYKNHRDRINSVRWDAVVADECHVLKEMKSETTRAMNEINALCRIGLTGTAIQNKYDELWTLLNWTNPSRFGTLQEWRQTISRPLTLGQSHDATIYQLSVARTTAKKLVQNLLPDFFLRRMKSLIANQLPRKTDRVVFCPLTDRQTKAYANFIDSEQVEFLRRATESCDCGSGGKRGWCCYKMLPGTRTSWFSLIFPTIQSLLKLANHLTLLVPLTDAIAYTPAEQDAGGDSDDDSHIPPAIKAANERHGRSMAVLQACCPEDWEALYRNRDSLVNLANPEFCGKWKVLRRLLRFWHDNGDKVLVFSHNVRLLRILQHLFHNTSYSVSYLDGSLSYDERQRVVDDFNSDPAQFVFLISTKAGGVGLNITSANKVVIFDPHWNPAYDLQAQDRAYRIGQVRDVEVFRLVSAGTIEEIVYARQIYKQQQANIGYNASTERRYFRGVQQDSERKGEIFGLNNLFMFHTDHVVLRDIVNKTNIAEAKAGVHLTAIDMEQAAADRDIDVLVKIEGATGANALANALSPAVKEEQDDDDTTDKKGKATESSSPKTKSDAIQAILASAGVEYTHDNSEVVGSSKVEAQLSRHAEMTLGDMDDAGDDNHNNSRAYGSSASDGEEDGLVERTPPPRRAPRELHGVNTDTSAVYPADDLFAVQLSEQLRYKPPEDVKRRQFCTLAKEAGFATSTDFAMVVEGWTPEQRRECLEKFYRKREQRLREIMEEGRETEDDAPEAGAADEIRITDAPATNSEHPITAPNVSEAGVTGSSGFVDVEPLVIVSDTVTERREPYVFGKEDGDVKESNAKSGAKLDALASSAQEPSLPPKVKREDAIRPGGPVRVKREPGVQAIIDTQAETQGETQGEPSLPSFREVRVKSEDIAAANNRVVVMLSRSPAVAASAPPPAQASVEEIPALPLPASARPAYEVIDDSEDTDEL